MFHDKFSHKLDKVESRQDTARQEKLEQNKKLFVPWKPEEIPQKPKEPIFIPYDPKDTKSTRPTIEKGPKPLDQTERQQKPEMTTSEIAERPMYARTEKTKEHTEKSSETKTENTETKDDSGEEKHEGLTEEEKAKIKEETGWSDEIIDSIQNMKQYEILKKADLVETEINGRKCLIRREIDLDYKDAHGKTNRERIKDGRAPLDSKTGQPIELHHLGQRADSPLVELTVEEHRTGEYENGKKNQSLWHDNTKETEVHGEGNSWSSEMKEHWTARLEQLEGEKNE